MVTYQTGNLILVRLRVYVLMMASNQWGIYDWNDLESIKIADTLPVGVEVKLLRIRGYSTKVVIFEILTGDLAGKRAVIHLLHISEDLMRKKD